MDLGVSIFLTDQSIGPAELAQAVEQRGFASLFFPEHTHMPVDHSAFINGGPLPEMYRRTIDPFVALSVASAVTETLRLGTGICLVAQRDPIILAKESATLDHVSGGRFVLGTGYGWNVPELNAHGVAWKDRRAVVRDRVSLIRSLWTDEIASSGSRHAPLAPSWSWPKPVQQPHPPVLLGAGLGPRTLSDLVAVFDGWMPESLPAVRRGLPRLQDAWRDAGRQGNPRVICYGARPNYEELAELGELGVTEATFWLPSGARGEVLDTLDQLASLASIT